MSLPRRFYSRPAEDVARDLLGKVLSHGKTAGTIVETEAYPGGDDLASHSAAGLTERTRVIFGQAGHAYVYLCYGIHDCFNVVTGREGEPGCVLIRAIDPLAGIGLMQKRRPNARNASEFANGPGKLTRALGITRAHNGADLVRGPITIHEGKTKRDSRIEVTPRIGITKCADRPLRFLLRY